MRFFADDEAMTQWQDDDEADLHETEDPSESDQDAGCTSVDLELCPFCRKFVYEHAQICNHCGNFIAFDDPPRRSFAWAIAGVVTVIGVLTVGLLYFCRW